MAPTARPSGAAASIGAIVGPTAAGKTELSVALATRIPLEILIADSRQVYRGMAIGTDRPGAEALAAARHHLLDIADPAMPISVADWVREARQVLPAIVDRGHVPLLVGGNGLYVRALLDGYALAGAPAREVRDRLAEELRSAGLAVLAERLRGLDPRAAEAIDLRNPRRVTRALERMAAGAPSLPGPSRPWRGLVVRIGLARPRDVLRRRIDERARALFDGGLLDEVAALLAAGLDPRRSPLTSHGYAEAVHVLAGEWSLDAAVEATARRTRQYARRQMTWFGGDPRIVWLDAADLPANDPALVDEAERLLRPRTA